MTEFVVATTGLAVGIWAMVKLAVALSEPCPPRTDLEWKRKAWGK